MHAVKATFTTQLLDHTPQSSKAASTPITKKHDTPLSHILKRQHAFNPSIACSKLDRPVHRSGCLLVGWGLRKQPSHPPAYTLFKLPFSQSNISQAKLWSVPKLPLDHQGPNSYRRHACSLKCNKGRRVCKAKGPNHGDRMLWHGQASLHKLAESTHSTHGVRGVRESNKCRSYTTAGQATAGQATASSMQ